MKNLLDLVSPQTKIKLEKVMEEQSTVIEAAVHEAFATMMLTEHVKKNVMNIVSEKMEEKIADYIEWQFEGTDFSDEVFSPLKETVEHGMKHFLGTEKAKSLAGKNIKQWIEDIFDDDDEIHDEHREELRELSNDLIRDEIRRIKEAGNAKLKGRAAEVAENLVERAIDQEEEEWDEEEEPEEEEEEEEEGTW